MRCSYYECGNKENCKYKNDIESFENCAIFRIYKANRGPEKKMPRYRFLERMEKEREADEKRTKEMVSRETKIMHLPETSLEEKQCEFLKIRVKIFGETKEVLVRASSITVLNEEERSFFVSGMNSIGGLEVDGKEEFLDLKRRLGIVM